MEMFCWFDVNGSLWPSRMLSFS